LVLLSIQKYRTYAMKLTLFDKKQEAKDVMSFKFKPDVHFDFKPGQYLFYTLPNDDPDNRGVTRYFTISSSPFEKFIMLTTRISLPPSSFKKSLVEMKIGGRITASGPDGDFIIDSDLIGVDDPKKNYIFIAGGIGITPFRSILLQMDFEKLPINVQLLYANRDEDVVFKEELESLAQRNPNFKIKYFISPDRIDEKALSVFNSLASRRSGQFSTLNFYVSGPEPFVESIEKILKGLGAEPQNIKLDFFPGYETSG